MSPEDVRKLREEKPDVYVVLLKNRHPKTWEAIERFNEGHGFRDIRAPQMVYNYINDVREWPKCEVCGKPAVFITLGRFVYSNTCSRLCARRSKTTLEKRKKTTMERYGVEFHTQSKEVKDKIKSTNREKYGADCILSLPEFQDKVKKTNLERYGVEYPTMSQEVRDRRDRNNIEKYGVKSLLQRPEIKDKMRHTTLERFGTFPAPQSLDNVSIGQTMKFEQGFETASTGFPDYELLTTREEYEHRQGHLKWRCKLCGREFDTYGATSQYPRCKCQHRDQEEVDFYTFVKSVAPDAMFNTRKTLPSGKEIDVYVPSRKIGFEFDGLYWHSDLRVCNTYHLDKTREAEKNGIRLIHIFSDEWEQRRDIVESFIRHLLLPHSHKDNLYARKCKCVELDKDVAQPFLNAHHIQGSDRAKHYVGLRKEDGSLVAVASFQPEQKGSGRYILSRYATDPAAGTICGGLGKLVAFFRKRVDVISIKTYADRRVSQGTMYEKIGFTRTKTIPPKYWYSKNFTERIHRFNLRKSEFKKNGLLYEDGKTELELAEMNGFHRIYDCGYYVYELVCK